MSKFRIWRHDKGPWFEAHFVDDPLPMHYFDLSSDDPWVHEGPIRVSVEQPPWDYFSCGPLDICSPRLQAVLADQPVEFLPVELSGAVDAGYAAMHVMARAPVVDRERSGVEISRNGKIMSVDSIVTDESVAPPAEIFLVSDSYLGMVFVTAEMAERLEGFTGLRTILPTARLW